MDVLRTNGPKKTLFPLKDFEVKIWLQPTSSCFSSHISLYSPTLISNNWVFSMSPESRLHWKSTAPHSNVLSALLYLSMSCPPSELAHVSPLPWSFFWWSFIQLQNVVSNRGKKIKEAEGQNSPNLSLQSFPLKPFPKVPALGFLSKPTVIFSHQEIVCRPLNTAFAHRNVAHPSRWTSESLLTGALPDHSSGKRLWSISSPKSHLLIDYC